MPESVAIDPIDTVYLFGTGAVEGAWDPVLRAIAKHQGSPAVDGDLANWWFNVQGRVVHLTSSWKDLSDPQLEARFGPGEHARTREAMARTDGQYRAQMRSLKEDIAREILAAQDGGELRARLNVLAAVAVDAGEGRTCVLTANWDLSLERLLHQPGAEPPKVLHLHGDVRNPTAMLLPGERPEEAYREDGDNATITSAYWQAMNVLKYARRVYVVGLSLSPLDAALGVALGMGLIGNQIHGEVVIVNKRFDEIRRIANQVRMVLPPGWCIREMPLPE